jgi:hypothetical protein
MSLTEFNNFVFDILSFVTIKLEEKYETNQDHAVLPHLIIP